MTAAASKPTPRAHARPLWEKPRIEPMTQNATAVMDCACLCGVSSGSGSGSGKTGNITAATK